MTQHRKRDKFDVTIDGRFIGHVHEDERGRGFRWSRFRESWSKKSDKNRLAKASRIAAGRMLLDERQDLAEQIAAREAEIRRHQMKIREARELDKKLVAAIELIRSHAPIDEIIERDHLVEDAPAA